MARNHRLIGLGFVAVLALPGCAYQPAGLIDDHYASYKARLPEKDRVFVCSSYGCRTQTPFKFTEADLAEVRKFMTPRHTATAAGEREATREALAWMGRRADKAVGTHNDRPGDDGLGNGDPGQMDCVDVATNLSSYLLVMERHKLFKHHQVGSVMVKEDFRRGFSGWTHYAAILKETSSGQQFAVDGWLLASGQPPEIVETERWYIDDKDLLFGTKSAVGANGT